jgi:hypothetical protein
MNADEARAIRVRKTSDQRDEFFGRGERLVADDLEITVLSRQPRFGNPADPAQARMPAKFFL